MSVENLHDLLKHELGDLLYAEKTILKGLKKMIRETKDPMVRERLEQHYTETEGQVTKLKLVKRQAYGRASLPLLRARLLPVA